MIVVVFEVSMKDGQTPRISICRGDILADFRIRVARVMRDDGMHD